MSTARGLREQEKKKRKHKREGMKRIGLFLRERKGEKEKPPMRDTDFVRFKLLLYIPKRDE